MERNVHNSFSEIFLSFTVEQGKENVLLSESKWPSVKNIRSNLMASAFLHYSHEKLIMYITSPSQQNPTQREDDEF